MLRSLLFILSCYSLVFAAEVSSGEIYKNTEEFTQTFTEYLDKHAFARRFKDVEIDFASLMAKLNQLTAKKINFDSKIHFHLMRNLYRLDFHEHCIDCNKDENPWNPKPEFLGFDMLFAAVGYGVPQLVKFLVNKGIDINKLIHSSQVDKNSHCINFRATSLFIAAISKNNEMVKFMLENNADANIRDLKGRTPLFFELTRSDLNRWYGFCDNCKERIKLLIPYTDLDLLYKYGESTRTIEDLESARQFKPLFEKTRLERRQFLMDNLPTIVGCSLPIAKIISEY